MRHGPSSGRFDPVGRLSRRPLVSEDERVCHHAECNTVLSRYNHTDVCALHEPRR
jgi:hypothetical protein